MGSWPHEFMAMASGKSLSLRRFFLADFKIDQGPFFGHYSWPKLSGDFRAEQYLS